MSEAGKILTPEQHEGALQTLMCKLNCCQPYEAPLSALRADAQALRELVRDFAANVGNYWSCHGANSRLWWICCEHYEEHASDCEVGKLIERARTVSL